jgi:hypothetical protein
MLQQPNAATQECRPAFCNVVNVRRGVGCL